MVLPLVCSAAATAEPLRFAAMGDVPYRVPEDFARFEALIEVVNRQHLAFVLHIGDIKSGSSPCTDAAYRRVHAYFGSVDAPLVFTPGDNEWTDCYRSAAGGLDPLERLEALRSLFFSEPLSLGARPMPLIRQSDADGSSPYVENARFMVGGVTVITAHVVGTNNNLRQGHPVALAEHTARDEATARWIVEGFEAARAAGSSAVVLAMHADLFTQGNGLPHASNRSGFARTLGAIAEGATRFPRPVLVIHGDSHVYRFDQPFLDANGRPLANAWRLEVFGYPQVAAVEVTVLPDAAEPFRVRTLEQPEPMPGDLRR